MGRAGHCRDHDFLWRKMCVAKSASRKNSGAPFITRTIDDLTVKLVNREGGLRRGEKDVLIEFRDRAGQPVDVGNVNLTIDINMPGMVVHGGGPAQKTGTAGQYRAEVRADMAGDWNAKLSFEGPHGQGQQSFLVTVK